MSQNNPQSQRQYWEQAGRAGYTNYMYSSGDVEEHVTKRLWGIAVQIGRDLGLRSDARVLDLGCGDGAFANRALAQAFGDIDGADFAKAGIDRANAQAPRSNIKFEVCDLTRADVGSMPHYDGVFLIGILHHVKQQTPAILTGLRKITPCVVVLEPNGDHVLRKLLELTPSYRAAREDSFKTGEVVRLFEEAGFRKVVWRRLNMFPNFTPRPVFRLLHRLEPMIEASPLLRALCTVNMYGFVRMDSASGGSLADTN